MILPRFASVRGASHCYFFSLAFSSRSGAEYRPGRCRLRPIAATYFHRRFCTFWPRRPHGATALHSHCRSSFSRCGVSGRPGRSRCASPPPPFAGAIFGRRMMRIWPARRHTLAIFRPHGAGQPLADRLAARFRFSSMLFAMLCDG